MRCLSGKAIVAVFIAVFSLSVYSGDVDVLKNAGFEDGWSFWDRGGHAKMSWDISSKIKKSGKKSLHIRNASPLAPNIYGTISQKIKVKPSTRYEFSLWIKARNARHIWFGGGKGWSLRKYCGNGSWDWKRVSVKYKTKADEREFNFRINFDGIAEDAWIDDIAVRIVPDPPPVKIDSSEAGRLLKGFSALRAKLWPLYVLVYRRCYEKRIPCEYEKLAYSVVKRFVSYGESDVADGKIKRAAYVLKYITRLYDDTEAAVKGYLDGTRQPVSVPRFLTSDIKIQDYGFTADTVFPATGLKQRKNVIFVGYGHFEQVRADIPNLRGFGTNIIQIEIGPNRGIIIPPRNEKDLFDVDTKPIVDDIVHMLKEAEINNIAVCLLLSPHYFPNFLMKKFPELKCENGFLKYDIYNPIAKKVMEAYLRAIVPMVKDYKSLQSFCISNEPRFIRPSGENYKKAWEKYLSDKFSGVDALNSICGTKFAKFADVPVGKKTKDLSQALYFEWITFNAAKFAGWHKWMAELIRSMAPEIPLHAKIRLHCTFDPLLTKEGVDPELFSDLSDINGCDCSCYFKDDEPITPAYLNEMMVYDMASSFRKAPVFNSEDHIINDGDKDVYSPGRAKHVSMILWQGAIHRRSASTIWLWERGGYELFQYRPDCLEAVGRTALDLNRLSDAITAFQNEQPKVAVLYSQPGFINSYESYKNSVQTIYRGLTFLGVPVAFVSPKMIRDGQLKRYNLVFLPGTSSVYPDVISGLNDFRKNGGRVVVVAGDPAKVAVSDEHSLPLSEKMKKTRAILFEGIDKLDVTDYDAFKTKLNDIIETLNLRKIVLKTSDGKIAEGIDWRAVEHDGKLLLNIANFTKKKQKLRVVSGIQECKIIKLNDLVANHSINGDVLEIQPLTHKLFELQRPE